MTPKVADAVRRLADAVLVHHCVDVHHDPDLSNEARSVDCVLALLHEIRNAPEFSTLHGWADKRLLAHAGDADGYRFCCDVVGAYEDDAYERAERQAAAATTD